MTIRTHILTAALAGFAAAGCNLSVPASDFPYEGPFIVIFTDAGDSPDDVEHAPDGDDVLDEEPELLITEVLVHSSNSELGFGEIGEFIEVKNIGDGPADPRNITLLLVDPGAPDGVPARIQVARPTTAEEVKIVSGLRPIAPGEHFVFVRYESPTAPISTGLEPGTSYDYGRYASGPTLSNDQARILELRYISGLDVIHFDSVRWEAGELRPLDDVGTGLAYPPDVSIGVRPDAENAADNDDPQRWCLSEPFIADSEFRGTPGASSACQ